MFLAITILPVSYTHLNYLEYADAVIVGRGFKKGEHVDLTLVENFMKVVRSKYD